MYSNKCSEIGNTKSSLEKSVQTLQGDISYGAEVEFENEALMAVRTANFLSGFLQVVDPKEIFPGK
jgi:hypothetical protein